MRWLTSGLAVALVLLAGCRAPQERDVLKRTTFDQAKRSGNSQLFRYPLPLKVGVTPTVQDFEGAGSFFLEEDKDLIPQAFGQVNPENVYKLPVTTTETDVTAALIRALGAEAVDESGAPLSGLNMFRELDPRPYIGTRGQAGIWLLPEADSEFYDYLIVPKVTRNYVAYTGSNDAWWIPGLIGWIFAWIPTYFVPDETFHSFLEVELEIYNVRLAASTMRRLQEQNVQDEVEIRQALFDSGALVYAPTAEHDIEDDVDDVDMGVTLTVLWSAVTVRMFGQSWGVLTEGNYENVSEVVTPPALAEVVAELADLMDRNFFGQIDEEGALEAFESAAPKAWAIVVGVNDYRDDALKQRSYEGEELVNFAEGDAAEMQKFLLDCDFPKSQVKALIGRENATKANIVKAFEALQGTKTLDDDLIVIYLAGQSAIDGPRDASGALLPIGPDSAGVESDQYRKYFLPSDASTSNLEGTGLELRRRGDPNDPRLPPDPGLIDLIDKLGSENVVVILDTGFGLHSYMPDDLVNLLDEDRNRRLTIDERPFLAEDFLEDICDPDGRHLLLTTGINQPVYQNVAQGWGEYRQQFITSAGVEDHNLLKMLNFVEFRVERNAKYFNKRTQPFHMTSQENRLDAINLHQ